MSDLTRRTFVSTSAGAAGLAALGAFGAADADAKHHRAKHHHPVVAWIGNPKDGHVTVMRGDREVTIRDHALAAKLANIAK